MAKRKKSGVILATLILLFLGMFAVFGPGVYNDSDQYIKMHIHREPLYPLFLYLLRSIFGELWLTAMGILQNAFAALSIWLFAEYVAKNFSLCLWEELVIIGFSLMPHMMTKYFSSLHLFITNSVMSEAICLPLFMLFLLECFRLLAEEDKAAVKRAAVTSLLYALLLSLTRSQMMLTIIMWAAVGCVRAVADRMSDRRERKRFWLRIAAAFVIMVLAFFTRTLAVKTYNYAFNGHFINNTYGTVNTLTNILYAADREDGERIEDAQAREFFFKMYDLTEESRANHKYAGESWSEKVAHIEEWHDTVKYKMIEDVFYQTYDKTVTSDYITQNLMADETAGKIIAGILPGCLGRWIGNYILIAGYGFIRSIAVVHPLMNWLALLLYLSAIFMAAAMGMKAWKEKRRIDDAVWLMGVSLLAIAANAFAVAITIMALSRYMIYGFTGFYTAYFILAVIWVRSLRETRVRKD